MLHHIQELSFNTHREFQTYVRENAASIRMTWLWHETLGNRAESFRLPGICDICDCLTDFRATPREMPEGDQFPFRVQWWSGTQCNCEMSNLDRAVIHAFLAGGSRKDRIYHVGHYSGFRRWLSERMPNVTDSQYEEGRKPGEISEGIRYEDLTGLSFADGEFDCVICMEILEHLPDYHPALREMARVLKPGGRALLSFPWLGGENYEHLVRAELLPDGSIKHILPPEYHGDSAKVGGILSFRSFGWKILDELRAAGFSKASAQFVFSPLHGYIAALTPVIVAVR